MQDVIIWHSMRKNNNNNANSFSHFLFFLICILIAADCINPSTRVCSPSFLVRNQWKIKEYLKKLVQVVEQFHISQTHFPLIYNNGLLTNYEMYIPVIVVTCTCEDLYLESIGICKATLFEKKERERDLFSILSLMQWKVQINLWPYTYAIFVKILYPCNCGNPFNIMFPSA